MDTYQEKIPILARKFKYRRLPTESPLKHKECYMRLPVTPGHEFSGKVIKLGPDAEKHHKVKRFFPAKIQTFVIAKNLNFRAKNGIFLIGING